MTTSNPKPVWQSKTVISGFVLAAISLLSAWGVQFSEAEQGQIIASIASVAALIGIIVGRIKADRPIGRPKVPGHLPAFAVLGLLVFAACGCIQTQSIDDEAVIGQNEAGNQAVITPEGRLSANYKGLGATVMNQDSEGQYLATPGIGSALSLDPETRKITAWFPKDAEITGLKVFAPDGSQLMEAEAVKTSASAPINSLNVAYATYGDIMKNLSAEQREVFVQALVSAGEITQGIADALVNAFIPAPLE